MVGCMITCGLFRFFFCSIHHTISFPFDHFGLVDLSIVGGIVKENRDFVLLDRLYCIWLISF